MADEKTEEIAPPVSVPVPSPSQIINPADIIKALLLGQSQQPTVSVNAGEGNYFGHINAEPEPVNQTYSTGGDIIPTRTGVQELHGMPTKAKHLEGPAVAPAQAISTTPIAAIMAMDAHKVNPHVELAKQRVLQALMQRKGGISPPPSLMT